MGIQVVKSSGGGGVVGGLQIKNNQLLTSTVQVVTDSANTDTGLYVSTLGALYKTLLQPYTVVSGAINFNCNIADMFSITLVNGTPTAVTLSNARTSSYVLYFKQPALGSATVTWATTIVWAGGSAPTLTTTANYVDIITLVYDGTTWRGTATLNFAS